MQQFKIELNNTKLNSYERISVIIILLNILSILALNFSSDRSGNFLIINIGLLIALAAALFIYFQNKKTENYKKSYMPVFLLLSLCWVQSGFYWLAVLNITFLFFDITAKRKLLLTITKQGIEYPSFPKKNIEWRNLNNIIAKDGLLTIDFKNNKLIQQSIYEPFEETDENEFNSFCQQQLAVKAD